MIDKYIKEDLKEIFLRNINWKCFQNKTVLITGAYGMLASYITFMLFYLHEEKHINVSIIAMVRKSEKFKDRFGPLAELPYVTVIESDLRQPIKIAGGVDYIIHAASLASPQYYSVCPIEVLEPNVIGNYHLLNLAVEKDVSGYLLFSTGDIYGAVSDVDKISEINYGVMDTLHLHNCYSESKRMAETMCKAYEIQKKVPVKIARIWHTYAPTMNLENDPRIFASFIRNIVNDENIIMKSNGMGKRCFCYITDAVVGFFTILLEGAIGEAYNICNETQFISVIELAEKLISMYPEKGIKVVRRERMSDEHYSENILLIGQDAAPSSEKLQSLGWKPLITIEDGFDRVIRYFENNRN